MSKLGLSNHCLIRLATYPTPYFSAIRFLVLVVSCCVPATEDVEGIGDRLRV